MLLHSGITALFIASHDDDMLAAFTANLKSFVFDLLVSDLSAFPQLSQVIFI